MLLGAVCIKVWYKSVLYGKSSMIMCEVCIEFDDTPVKYV